MWWGKWNSEAIISVVGREWNLERSSIMLKSDCICGWGGGTRDVFVCLILCSEVYGKLVGKFLDSSIRVTGGNDLLSEVTWW